MKNKEELRMYFFVMYNLSGIQKGIQAGHAAIEYQLLHGKKNLYKDFAKNYKTFILLDGGGSIDMIDRVHDLEGMEIDHAIFQEPDLNNSISAVAFILPESVFNYKIATPEDINYWLDHDPDKESQHLYFRRFRLASN